MTILKYNNLEAWDTAAKLLGYSVRDCKAYDGNKIVGRWRQYRGWLET